MQRILPAWIVTIAIGAAPAQALTAVQRATAIDLAEPTLAAPPADIRTDFEHVVPGGWDLVWDPRTRCLAGGVRGRILPAAPRAAANESAALAAATEFRRLASTWLGADGADLVLVRNAHWGHAWHVSWQQTSGDVPVVDAFLDVTVAASGAVVAFRAALVPAPAHPAAPDRVDAAAAVAAVERRLGQPLRSLATTRVAVRRDDALVAALQLDLSGGRAERWDALVAASDGAILRLANRVCTFEGHASADVAPHYADDPPASMPLPWLHVDFDDEGGAQSATTDAGGRYDFPPPQAETAVLRAQLVGLYTRVSNAIGEPSPQVEQRVADGFDVHFDDVSGRLDERTIYVHANIIHDFVRSTFDFQLMDFPLPAVAGLPDYANAYWDGEGIHFGDGGLVFHNLGLFADVIYHEYTHGITDYMYRAMGGLYGAEGAALHEALSDYFACTLTGEPRVGERLRRNAPNSALRNLDNVLRWPDDRQNEEHADGEIFGGALWDVRASVGRDVADRVIHFARALAPRTFEAYCNAVLLQDDLLYGDGQAANGSPHRGAILAAFAAHGIGPAAGPGRRLVHVPAGDTEDVGQPRTLRAGFEGHASGPTDSLVLEYSNGGAFVAVGMQRLADGDFAAVVPGSALTEGAAIEYWIRTVVRRGLPMQVLPPGAPANRYAFRVGPDLQPPRIEHLPVAHAAAIAWPATIEARIDDNLGIATVWIETWLDGSPSAGIGLVRDPVDRSRWTGRFVNVGGVGTVVDYRVMALDASRAGLTTCMPACDATYRCVVTPTLADDFESGSGGCVHTSVRAGRPDAWHLGPLPDGGAGQAWVCGGAAGMEYAPGLAAALESPTLQIGSNARAGVRSWIDAEPNAIAEAFDAGIVEVEVDGNGIWRPIAPESGYTHVMAETEGANVLAAGTPCLSGRDATWRQLWFDLGPWSGRRVRLRFVFASDATPSQFLYRGWALDDLTVDPGVFDPADAGDAAPAALRAEPAASPGRGRVGIEVAVPPDAGRLRARLYDARGALVAVLWDGESAPGRRRLEWDGTDRHGVARAAGVYYYRIDSRAERASGKLVLLR